MENLIKKTKKANKYQIADQKNKESWAKAEKNGQFVTKEDLQNLKPLIIYIIRRSLFYNTHTNLVTVMQELLNTKLVFRTKRGIKGVVTNATKMICKKVCYNKLSEKYEVSELSSYTNREYKNFQTFYLNIW